MGYLGVGGNVWWVQTLVVSSLIRKGLSFILQWRPSISSSSRHPLLPLLDVYIERDRHETTTWVVIFIPFLYDDNAFRNRFL